MRNGSGFPRGRVSRRPPRNRVSSLGLLARRLRSHRRVAAAVLLGLAAALAVRTATGDAAVGTPILTAARDLPAGHVLSDGDLTRVAWPRAAVPDGTLGRNEALGRRLSAPLRRGEALTDSRLAGPGQLTGQPPDTVALAVGVAEPTVLSLVQPGAAVRVLAGSRAPDALEVTSGGVPEVLVERAVVLSLPPARDGGLLADTTRAGSVVLAMSTREALRVADAAEHRYITVAVLP